MSCCESVSLAAVVCLLAVSKVKARKDLIGWVLRQGKESFDWLCLKARRDLIGCI